MLAVDRSMVGEQVQETQRAQEKTLETQGIVIEFLPIGNMSGDLSPGRRGGCSSRRFSYKCKLWILLTLRVWATFVAYLLGLHTKVNKNAVLMC